MNYDYLIFVPFLVGFFPFVFLWIKNINEVSLKKISLYFVGYSIIFIFLFWIISIFNSSIIFINTVILFLLFIFYRWQRLYKTSQRVLLTIQLVLIFLLLYKPLYVLTMYLYIYIVLLILLLIVYFILIVHAIKYYYLVDRKKINKSRKINNTLSSQIINPANIYFIVPDTYPNNNILQKFFGFDNKEFIQQLEKLGFVVAENAHSNYITTDHCLSSMLNMDYIDNFMNYNENESQYILFNRLQNYLINNRFVKQIQELGYKYYHIANYWELNFANVSDCADNIIRYKNNIDYETVLFKKTLLAKLIKKINFFIIRNSHLFAFNMLNSSINFQGPKFVYAHLICPHAPFCFDDNGNVPQNLNNRCYVEDYDNIEEFSRLYLSQIKYLNKRLLEIVTNIKEKDRNAIIIIQSDHGSDYTWLTNYARRDDINYFDLMLERFNPFRAIYAPNGFNHDFGSSVNLLRSIISYISNNEMPLLENKYLFYTRSCL